MTYVDDEAAMLTARTPKLLDAGIAAMIKSYVDAFRRYWLQTNWRPGKSEALLVYRGEHATTCLNARRAGGNIQIPVPGGEQHLHVVTDYKHLGGVIASNASIIPEMRQRTTSAMAAYGPIAMKVFGCTAIQEHLKLHFVRGLILPRLLHNVLTLVMTPTG